MFDTIARVLGRRKRSREIFAYSDGKRLRYADPLVVLRQMAAHAELDLDATLRQMQAVDSPELQNEACGVAVQATREIFGLPAFGDDNPDGLTELETLDVLTDFVTFLDNVKKNSSGSLI